MTRMLPWVIVLLAGLAVIAVYPLIPQSAEPMGTGMFPEYLVPAAYAVAGIGATGMFIAWIVRREKKRG
ncbi:hypothetical protein [Pseudoruegeria sp. HB172150]|uniref:hypothetical protein n=1 Tax=Pseudoruegeria sp. HB172150 TaxID=2721164 RepID=UPI00155277C3|nr:hypothetical protein [Pseudoruegeria sp. HB172150]